MAENLCARVVNTRTSRGQPRTHPRTPKLLFRVKISLEAHVGSRVHLAVSPVHDAAVLEQIATPSSYEAVGVGCEVDCSADFLDLLGRFEDLRGGSSAERGTPCAVDLR